MSNHDKRNIIVNVKSEKLSVVIPVKDNWQGINVITNQLANILCSVQLDLIILDDMSKDEYEKSNLRQPEFSIIRASSGGSPYKLRNRGISCSKFDNVALLDAKCILSNEYLESISRPRTDWDIIGGEITPIIEADPPLLTLAYSTLYLRTNPKYFEGRPSALTGNMLLKKSVWQALGGFKETRSGNDVEFVSRARAAGYKVSYDPDLIVHYPAKTPAEVIQFLKRIAKNGQNNVGLSSLRPPNPKPINMRLQDIGVKLSTWRWVQLYMTIWYVRFLKFYYQYI